MTAGSNTSPKTSRKSTRRRSILSGDHGAPLRFKPTAQHWEQMELSLGKPIDSSLRDNLIRIADEYLYWETMERSAPFCTDEESHFTAVKARCRNLSDILTKIKSNAEKTASIKLSVRFNRRENSRNDDNSIGIYPSELDIFKTYLLRMIHACNEEIKISQSEDGHSEGDSWNLMVRKVTTCFKEAGLPTSGSNDNRKSAFVNFMKSYQLAFPATSTTKGLHSDIALKSAIHRARKSASGAAKYE